MTELRIKKENKHSLLMSFSSLQRMDLGECMKVHDLALRADYEIASKEQEYFFELDVSLNNTMPISLKDQAVMPPLCLTISREA